MDGFHLLNLSGLIESDTEIARHINNSMAIVTMQKKGIKMKASTALEPFGVSRNGTD
jgi:hypothetical protein